MFSAARAGRNFPQSLHRSSPRSRRFLESSRGGASIRGTYMRTSPTSISEHIWCGGIAANSRCRRSRVRVPTAGRGIYSLYPFASLCPFASSLCAYKRDKRFRGIVRPELQADFESESDCARNSQGAAIGEPRLPSDYKKAETKLSQYRGSGKEAAGGDVLCTQQRQLCCILVQDPITAGSAQFCLFCGQPEPIPRSSTARTSRLAPWGPCRLPA